MKVVTAIYRNCTSSLSVKQDSGHDRSRLIGICKLCVFSTNMALCGTDTAQKNITKHSSVSLEQVGRLNI